MVRFNVVVVGAGMASDFWLPTLVARPDVVIAGVVDLDDDRARGLVQRYGLGCPWDTDLATALARANGNLVIDITPPEQHRLVAEAALRAGCDVLGEKPLAGSLEDARAICDAARSAGRTHAVMQNRRFAPGMRALKTGLDAGLIGRPTIVCADMFLAPHHFGGFREEAMASPLLLDMAIHTFDQARFLTGAAPVSVQCYEFNPQGSWYAGNAAAVCVFDFADGTVFSYRGCWVSEGCTTSFDAAWRIVGTAGTVVWDGVGQPHAEVVSNPAERTYFLTTTPVEWPAAREPCDASHHAEAIDALLNTLAAGGTPETNCADNLASLAMVLAAIEGAWHHEIVELDAVERTSR